MTLANRRATDDARDPTVRIVGVVLGDALALAAVRDAGVDLPAAERLDSRAPLVPVGRVGADHMVGAQNAARVAVAPRRRVSHVGRTLYRPRLRVVALEEHGAGFEAPADVAPHLGTGRERQEEGDECETVHGAHGRPDAAQNATGGLG